MASFLRSLLQVLLGFVLGVFAGFYLYTRVANQPRTPAPTVAKAPSGTGSAAKESAAPAPGGDVAKAGDTTLFGRRGGGSPPAGTFAEPRVEPTKPAAPAPAVPVVQVEAPPAPEPKPEPAVPVAEEPVDFRELCIKPAAWPPVITLNKEINAQVMQGEEVIAEIPLSAGEKLQVSKVFGDATAEVRAKGAKFIVKAADTDLAAQARVRLAEISGRVRAPAPVAPVAPTPSPEPAAKTPAPAPTQPSRSDDLDSKMRSLFGTPQKR